MRTLSVVQKCCLYYSPVIRYGRGYDERWPKAIIGNHSADRLRAKHSFDTIDVKAA